MVEKTALLRPASSKCGRGEYEEYHPYGTTAWWAEKSGIDVSRKRYRYTGQEKDEETGLCYHHHRYYMPWLGRWASADPAGLADGPNRWGYTHAGPSNGRDPNGLADLRGTLGLSAPPPLESHLWRPMSSDEFRAHAHAIDVPEGGANALWFRRVYEEGRLFQELALASGPVTGRAAPENTQWFESGERELLTALSRTPRSGVIPDHVTTLNSVPVRSGEEISQLGTLYTRSGFVEVKLTGGTIYTSTSNHQIAGHLDVLSKSPAAKAVEDGVPGAPHPVLLLVTPSDAVVANSLIADATARGVELRVAHLEFAVQPSEGLRDEGAVWIRTGASRSLNADSLYGRRQDAIPSPGDLMRTGRPVKFQPRTFFKTTGGEDVLSTFDNIDQRGR